MKKFSTTVNGKELKFEEKSYAAIFRNFFNHFIAADLKKTKEVIELVNIRTSDSELFIAKNGSKKKNIPLDKGIWIYTHLTPAAMQKAYEKFVQGWEGKYTKPEPKPTRADDLTAVPETDDDLAPEVTNAAVKAAEKKQSEKEAAATAEVDETVKTEITKEQLAKEMFDNELDKLTPQQKGKVTKEFNKINKKK